MQKIRTLAQFITTRLLVVERTHIVSDTYLLCRRAIADILFSWTKSIASAIILVNRFIKPDNFQIEIEMKTKLSFKAWKYRGKKLETKVGLLVVDSFEVSFVNKSSSDEALLFIVCWLVFIPMLDDVSRMFPPSCCRILSASLIDSPLFIMMTSHDWRNDCW